MRSTRALARLTKASANGHGATEAVSVTRTEAEAEGITNKHPLRQQLELTVSSQSALPS